ncbi:zinc finger protein on ecdysone puffs isoform X2 [Contarinia nasturtii]|uniref:zinc finger protein on ecdysone puffs isoform X2 n=1 Tax=Contarinia nasturtii TaxID=265458 RepID=UPI0012D472FE|nr:zinc finger protein on ecdysone puffs isoform X2 [Contarinia nasturtii]
MAFRMNGGGNRRNDNNRNFDRGYGNGVNRQINPWDNNAGGGNFRQGGGGGGNVNNDVISLANSLVNNLLRGNQPPSLLDLPQRGAGYGNQMNFGRFDERNGRGNKGYQLRGPTPFLDFNDYNGMPGKQHANNFNNKNQNRKSNNSKTSAKSNNKDAGANKEANKKESKYADVPNVMFYCHMCKKHMWDATSFENHVKGRTHLMMREGVEESYRLKANMIRQEAKIEEQLKSIELERLKRMGKAGKGNFRREYCTMCDLNFYGHLTAHRKTDGHLNLKKFLHPKCLDCSLEFPNRIDFDGHILSPEHMKRAFITKANKPEKRKNQLTIYTEDDELKDLKEEKEEKKKEKKATDAEESMETDDTAEKPEGEVKKENGEEEAVEGKEESKEGEEEPAAEPVAEPDDIILDYEEGDEIPTEVDGRIPKYNCSRQVGISLIHKLDCYECYVCGRFFDTEKTSEIHTRTVTHHRNFVKFLNEKANDTKIAQKRAAAALEEIERKKKKLEAAEAAANATEEEKQQGDEAYDPTETTDDPEDDEKIDEPMETQEEEQKEQEAEAVPEVAANGVEQEQPPAAFEAPVAEPVETKEEVATPKRVQRARGRGRNARL